VVQQLALVMVFVIVLVLQDIKLQTTRAQQQLATGLTIVDKPAHLAVID